jgi:LacI family transcriptional regulator
MSAESFGPKNEECLAALSALRLPVILADCFNDTGTFSVVAIDNREGSRLAIRYLLDLGHRLIGCITGPLGITTNQDRLTGYTGSLVQANITPDDALVYEGDFRYQSGYDGALYLMKQKAKAPTALFCHNDMMAFGAARGLRDLSLRIPQDVSLVGFDDIFFSQYMDVPLTTIVQPVYEMGLEACEVLLEEITGKSPVRQRRIFSPRLVIRQSAGPPCL